MTKDELIKKLFKEYGLIYDKNNPESRDNDIYIHKHYKIITRPGIDKIKKAAGITVEFDPINGSCGPDWCNLRATGYRQVGNDVLTFTTFASANASTCRTGYYPEMAEKRANSRIVLQMTGLYEEGFYGSDEIDKGKPVEEEKPSGVEKKTLFSQNV